MTDVPRSTSDDRKPILVVGHRRPEGVDSDFGAKVVDGQRKVPGSVRRLEGLLGLRQGCLLRAVDAVNLLGPHDEDTDPRRRLAAETLRMDVEGRELIILCGRQVHIAFRLGERPTVDEGGETVTVEGVVTVLLPHPSARNRDWNDVERVARVKAALAALTAPLIPEKLLEDSTQAAAARTAVTQTKSAMDKILEGIRSIGWFEPAVRASRTCSLSAAYAWRKRDPEFDRACVQAGREFNARICAEAAVRAVHGEDHAVRYQGEVVGTEKRKSDVLLLRLLAARMPEMWSERRQSQVTGSDGGPVTVRSLLEAMTEEED